MIKRQMDSKGRLKFCGIGFLGVVCALALPQNAAAFAGERSADKIPAITEGQASPGASASNKAAQDQDKTKNDKSKEEDDGLAIEPTELPTTYPKGPYRVIFHGRGNYVPVLHWSVQHGSLPPGIRLEDNGELHGEAQRAGEFEFTVVVRDGGKPQQVVQQKFVLKVVEAITVKWKVPAHVNVNRIEGSVEVSNATVDDVDLTFDVKAVAENGRATEIGYQHFPLTKGTVGMTLPFGESLPYGAYVVYVSVVGEVAKRNAIYRENLQTPGALHVTMGP